MGTLLVRGVLAIALLLTAALPAWAQDTKGVGVVTALTGRADLKRPQAPEASLKLRDNLFVRDVVDTHKESVARVLLLGKSTVTVRELSRFEIREEILPDGSERALINLATGRIRVMVARRLLKPGDEIQIRTPNAIAAVRGSDGVFEVSTLPDGRPQTIITGGSGEFQLTLPTTPPFIARGKEFFDGPVQAAAPSPLLAMADVASDAPAGIQVAQAPGLSVAALVQAQITGFAGAQTLAQALLSQTQVNQIFGRYQVGIGATGTNLPPAAATDRAAASGLIAATGATLVTGAQPGLAPVGRPGVNGGGNGVIKQPVILPTTTQSLLVAAAPIDTRISVLVYDSTGLRDTLNGLTGSGKLFNATYVSSTVFSDTATWTAAQINQFRVFLVGSTDSINTTGLVANKVNVANAVTGNQVITGLHVEHNTGQANQFLINALQWAALGGAGKTGLVATTDGCATGGTCFGAKNGTWKDTVLSGSFQGSTGTDANKITITRDVQQNSVVISNAAQAVNSGSGLTGGQALTNVGLSPWNNSAHSTFSNPPAATGYQVIQTSGGAAVTLVK